MPSRHHRHVSNPLNTQEKPNADTPQRPELNTRDLKPQGEPEAGNSAEVPHVTDMHTSSASIPLGEEVCVKQTGGSTSFSQAESKRSVVTKLMKKRRPKMAFLFEEEEEEMNKKTEEIAPKSKPKLAFLFDEEKAETEEKELQSHTNVNIPTAIPTTQSITLHIDQVRQETIEETNTGADTRGKTQFNTVTDHPPRHIMELHKGAKGQQKRRKSLRQQSDKTIDGKMMNRLEEASTPSKSLNVSSAPISGTRNLPSDSVKIPQVTTKYTGTDIHGADAKVLQENNVDSHYKVHDKDVENESFSMSVASLKQDCQPYSGATTSIDKGGDFLSVGTAGEYAAQTEEKGVPARILHNSSKIYSTSGIKSAGLEKQRPKITKIAGKKKLTKSETSTAAVKQKVEEEVQHKRTEEDASCNRMKEEEVARKRAEEEMAARKRAEEEIAARIRAKEEAARTRAEEEIAARIRAKEEAARTRAEEEIAARIRAKEEAARTRAEEEEAARIRAKEEEAARIRAEEEAALKRIEEEAAAVKARKDARKKAREEALRKKAEKEAARKRVRRELRERARRLEEQRRTEEEVARTRAEEEAARIRAKEEEAARIRAEEEEARIRAEEEAARIRAKEEEAARIRAEEEEAARIRAEEEAARIRAEEEEAARTRAEEEEAARIRAKEEEAARIRAEEEAALKRIEEEAAAVKARKDARKKAREEALRKKAEKEAARKRARRELRERTRRLEEQRRTEEEAARIRAEEEAARIRAKEEEAARIRAEEEEAARIRAEEEAARIRAEEEAARIRAEEEAARIRAEEEEARIRAKEEEAARIRAKEEAARIRAKEEEAARIRAEEEEAARIRAKEEAARIRAKEEEAARIRAEEEEEARKKTVSSVVENIEPIVKERRRLAKKKIERYRKQVVARHSNLAVKEMDVKAAVAQGVVDIPLIPPRASDGTVVSHSTVAATSEETLLNEALAFPSGNVTIERFDENELVAKRRSSDDPWDIGLRFDWTVKTLAIGSLPLFSSTDPRRRHPFVLRYQSRPVWFLEEVNGAKANNIREVMEVLKKSLTARFVFKK